MLDLQDFLNTVYETFESHFGDICPFNQDDLIEVHDLLDSDMESEALKSAFEEADINMDGLDNQFFDDLSTELREMVPA